MERKEYGLVLSGMIRQEENIVVPKTGNNISLAGMNTLKLIFLTLEADCLIEYLVPAPLFAYPRLFPTAFPF